MEKTGNSIVLKNHFVGIRREMQPVMRNGKPTKRMKEVIVHEYADVIAWGYMIDGHEVFIKEGDLEREHWTCFVYRQDGTMLDCVCQFGAYGTADHISPMMFNKLKKRLECYSDGYNGATGRGWGATIKRVNW